MLTLSPQYASSTESTAFTVHVDDESYVYVDFVEYDCPMESDPQGNPPTFTVEAMNNISTCSITLVYSKAGQEVEVTIEVEAL
ncbi:MAG: hypothetical protein LBV04_05205 [Deferribacteraceae bacterium]|jgi:hypothetical protein|nr:hypothetical protein [Deferribacteraceae bacterium]